MSHPILGRRPQGKRTGPKAIVPICDPVHHPQEPTAAPTPTEQGSVTAVIVNFKTIDLTRSAVETLRMAYPDVPLILTDNGSQDSSTQLVAKFNKREGITAILNDQNLGHGNAIEQAFVKVRTEYVFLMDSDCIVKKSGFLAKMIAACEEHNLYATGWLRWVDKLSGVPREWHLDTPPSERFIPYIHPAAGLYHMPTYYKLPPAFHHGAPLLQNMVAAYERGLKVKSFPIFQYVDHLIAGTRRMYGGHWEGKGQPKPWKKKDTYPI